MKMLNAWTVEIDELDVAVAQIIEQLDMENSLLAHSAGFITCSYEYVEAGTVESICKALPFDVVGCTTLTNSNNQRSGILLLCLSVLTADDCLFSTALTRHLEGDICANVDEAFQRASASLDDPPGLILAFMPMVSAISGEDMLGALDRAAGGAPIFGTVGCDSDPANFEHTYTIHNGICAKDRMSMLLISGRVTPRFVVCNAAEHNLYKQQAIITASEGNILKEVNNVSARDYFASIGLMHDDGLEAVSSVPFVIDSHDGSQAFARAIYTINDDGSAICGGTMPEGGTLSIGRLNISDILVTTERSLNQILANENLNGVIMFPCLGRNVVLGATPLRGIDKVREMLGHSLPWHLAYSGGEVCPVRNNMGDVVNRFHNFTFIACAI